MLLEYKNLRIRNAAVNDDIPIGEMCYYNLGNKTAEIGIKICDFSRQEGTPCLR